MSKQILAQIQGMTTVVPIEDISPEFTGIPISVQASRYSSIQCDDHTQICSEVASSECMLLQESMSLACASRVDIDIESLYDMVLPCDQCDDLTQICSKLLQAQICSEFLQALSNNAAEDDWWVSILNYVVDTTDKPQIQRIPSLLVKQSNKNCYDPLVVSIGPYHHGNPQLEAFEKLKIPIAQKFVCACCDQLSFKQLREAVEKVGESVRKCYEKNSIKVDDNYGLFRMMFLDACFVLYFIIYVSFKTKDTDMQQKEADPLHRWSSYLVSVQRDLFLLENQIPLLVLEVFMKFLFKGEKPEWEKALIQRFLGKKVIMPPEENSCIIDVKKFLAQMMGRSDQEKEKWKLDMDAPRPHLLHLLREQLTWSSPEDENKKKSVKCLPNLVQEQPIKSSPEDKNKKKSLKWHSYRSVTELKSAGIHFRPSQTNSVTDVKFKSHLISGTITLPPIVVDDSTKALLLNLVAYEMCSDGPSDYHIRSYIWLMDSLIDNADDVKELRRRRILVNNLGSDEDLAQLFNEIANDLVFDPSVYAKVKLKIQNHCKSKAKVWMAEWMHDHFSSPWAFLAFLGAIFVIALTVVQTYFAVFPH